MGGMKKARVAGMVLLASLALSCAGNMGFVNYREGLFQGYRSLQHKDYEPALQQFLRANRGTIPAAPGLWHWQGRRPIRWVTTARRAST